MRAVFIRAPWLAEYGDAVEILASVDGHPVAARQDNMLVISFHPEIAGEDRACTSCSCAGRRRVIFFTRHGESVANVADRELRPRPEDADSLSERGWEQARGVGERLRGEGIEAIVASHYGRAQETASAIGEVLGLPFETDPDLHEVRQADAYYTSAPEYGDTGSITWMPTAERDFARPGAESFDTILARVDRVQERLAVRDDTVLASRTGASCTSSSAARSSATSSAPHHLRRCSGSRTPTPASRSSSGARTTSSTASTSTAGR